MESNNGKTFSVLRTFDAFPKTQAQYQQSNDNTSKKITIKTILFYLYLLFIAWSEFGSFFGGYLDEQYIVDDTPRETAQINIDFFIRTPCELLNVAVRDQTRDIFIISEKLNFENMPFFIPGDIKAIDNPKKVKTPELDELLSQAIPAEFREKLDTSKMIGSDNFDGCHIFGSVPITKVEGQLQITSKMFSPFDIGGIPADAKIDFSHVINELSFGEFFPYIDNQLDNTARLTNKPATSFKYSLHVVPTIYKSLGATLNTNQYSLSESISEVKNIGGFEAAGIMISYKFESLTVVVEDKRISFLQFIVRLITILCLIVYITTWLYKLADKILILIGGKKWSLYDDSPMKSKQGLLDS
ncbi:related to ER-derived vesicles protein ERV41 [Saccharomycodes ludwigii]|uniref:Endoplasmic reticulum-Golgi intermediate compartment protein n=1 Tax=Saccharomycodes ludwigii TaxID=36035 RepID=A0A376B289_9ASCO|nr:hypothetical protein SCDLUD_004344 [Saccharomycodes ludwigii]KAH3900027.1 hypothetical protein SCDLUD_004344 [Saccharomycodes ludwigii]SSD58798.1 related to ER-derived vesicles protein ERV41 [Saccharomycodes ludwigii]